MGKYDDFCLSTKQKHAPSPQNRFENCMFKRSFDKYNAVVLSYVRNFNHHFQHLLQATLQTETSYSDHPVTCKTLQGLLGTLGVWLTNNFEANCEKMPRGESRHIAYKASIILHFFKYQYLLKQVAHCLCLTNKF